MALTIEQIQSLDRASLDKMTSDSYKENYDSKTNPLAGQFRARIEAIERGPRTTTRPAGSVRGPEPSATPASTSFDPSFDDVPASAPDFPAAAPAPVAAQPAAQPAAVVTDFSQLPELEHSYQPMVDGKPAGGRQTFRYRTVNDPNDPNSLVLQLQRAHSYASARIRTLSRDRKLDSIAAAGAAPRTQTEKEVPTTVEGLAVELKAQREQNFALSVRAAVNEFQASVDWAKYRSNENAQSVILAVERAADDPTDPASYQRAFNNMKEFLVPVAMEPIPAPAPAPVAATPAPATPAVRPANTSRIATGLSNADQTSLEDPVFEQPIKVVGVKLLIDGKSQMMDFRSWDRLSSDSQKKILRNSANAAAINALYDAENERRAAARGGR
jgi:hypothetical protein